MTSEIYKILIVDDEEQNRKLLSRCLTCDQYTLYTAENGIKALELAKTISLDLVLLDVSMPMMDGYEVCRALKVDEATKNIPGAVAPEGRQTGFRRNCAHSSLQQVKPIA